MGIARQCSNFFFFFCVTTTPVVDERNVLYDGRFLTLPFPHLVVAPL